MTTIVPFIWSNAPATTVAGLSEAQEGALAAATRRAPVATIAALQALTPTGGDIVYVAGYATAGDGGEGFFRFASESAVTTNGGTVIAPTAGAGRWLRQYSGPVNVRWFGAVGNGVTSDRAAIIAAELAAADSTLYFPPGTYLLSASATPIDVVNASSVSGSAGAVIAGSFYIKRSDIEVSSLKFIDVAASGASNPTASVFALNMSDIRIIGCWFDRTRLQIYASTATPIENVSIRGCRFTGDYSEYADNSAPYVVWIEGANDVAFCDNHAEVTNPYTFSKIVAGPIAELKRVLVTGNVIIAAYTSGKQLFDFYNGARELIITGNNVRMTGNCTTIFEQKGNGTGGYVTSPMTNVVVSGNVARGEFKRLCLMQGLYGSAAEVAHQRVSVVGNVVDSELASSPDTAIDIRGVTQAIIANNSIGYPGIADSVKVSAILLASVKSAVISGNSIATGSVTIAYLGGTDISYTKGVENLTVVGNAFLNFTNYAAVFINEQPGGGKFLISGNLCTKSPTATGLMGNIYVRLGAAAELIAIGNSGSHATGISNSGTVTLTKSIGNSWDA